MLLKLTLTKPEVPGVRSFVWEKPAEFTFYPGQYLDYKLPIIDPNSSSRSFTLASSPTEDFLMLTAREGQSIFKQKLFSLKPGETIETSHPAGTFILDETAPAVMIAGGIGITPFRSMIKYAVDQKLKTPITLIYLNSNDDFPFKNALKAWQKNLPNLTIQLVNTTKEGLLDDQKLQSLTTNCSLPTTIYYLAGPPPMVDNFDAMLQSLRVDKTNIRCDHFGGY
ncbi:MAG: FAD-dependent oxidoreductase [Candidatus Daviesbacteria bacterium]|nr:MAG: FAD-dependent oxidoreductase [Candidatus Daviesbacteria bacterium]